MEDIIEEVINEALKQDSLKDLELEAVGKIQDYNVILRLERFGDDWIVQATNNSTNTQRRTFGDYYRGAKESFELYVKKYKLKDRRVFERNKSIKYYVLIIAVFIILTIELLIFF